MRLCTAEVHEAHRPRKLGRGVELRRIEVAMMMVMVMVMMTIMVMLMTMMMIMVMTIMVMRSMWI